MSSAPKINQIPSELLTLIFATGLRSLSYDAHRPLLALICSVCRHWRDIAIAASELWTTIHIPLDLHVPATLAFLERSKGRLIDVYIRAVDIDRDRLTYSRSRAAATITAVTTPHIPRVRTLVMVLADPDLYTIFSDAYRSISAPDLTSLSIHLDDCFWKPGAYPPGRFVANANSLCRFVTQGNLLNVVPSRTSLTTLDLSKYSPTHVELQDLFNSSPYLETLILRDFDRKELVDLPMEHDATSTIITAPITLKSLAVSLYWHTHNNNSATSCSCILGSLRTPNLEYLEVVGILGVGINLKVHFGPLDKLRTLRLQRCSISSAVEEFSLSLKELRRLELVDLMRGDMRYIVDPPSSFPFPRLSSVFFSTTEGNTGRDFPYQLLQFAERCIAAGCPHFTLEVEEGHYGEFFNTFESRIQDGRVCIIENDYGGLIMDEKESEEMPGWEDDDSDRWGDGEEWPEDEEEEEVDGWDDPGWEDGEEYLSDEWPEYELEESDSDIAL
ncbi:hypothetical protein EDD18DRAFT_547 [Armillaria luteobubalina]|uniref:F-box domain-containing protein n=1 Tax=Armillaria luteobubalina TaxID=153913 RepID=A0AA39QNM6_9AGAR|nr:hypothetical protein EDD18DRAFT_547 [Armillaria luteobubalina]